MREVLRRPSLELGIQAALAATIVAAVLSAGAILSWIPLAKKLRWGALLVLAVLALVAAARRRGLPGLATALAAAFCALAVASAGWSVAPSTSLSRAVAFGVLLGTAAALAAAAARRPETVERVLDGVLAGVLVVAVGGLLVLAFEHDRAVQPATANEPARYQGLGGNPNTATMVMAIGVPLAAAALASASARRRAVGFGSLALLLGSIVASGSRGAVAGAFAGLLVVALAARTGRARVAAVGAVAVALAAAIVAMQLPDPDPNAVVERASETSTGPPVTGAGYRNAEQFLRLEDDIGHPRFGEAAAPERRTIFGTSGRAQAWDAALGQAAERPLLGYGFGTEERVFVDRYAAFQSDRPENSYLGLLLQLGVVGFALLLAVVVTLAAPALRRWRGLDPPTRRLAGAALGALAVGLVLAVFQSYAYAPGSNATAAAWVCAFLVPIAAGAGRA